MSSSVDDVQSGATRGEPTRKKLKTAEIEFCKKTASHFSLSSDGEFGRVESDSDDDDEDDEDFDNPKPSHTPKEWKHKSKTIGEILSYNHANLTSVVIWLMVYRKMDVLAQMAFVKGDYLDTGKHDDFEDLELGKVSVVNYCAAGHVEQAIVAGLQIVYHFAKSGRLNGTHTAKDAKVTLSHNKAIKFTRFDVFYKVNGYDTKLAVIEEGKDSYMSLYIKD